MKYILIEFKQGRQDEKEPIVRQFPFIFPDALVHADVYKTMCYAIREESVENKHCNGGFFAHDFKCVSAGSISSTCLNGFYGKSETLGVKSREKLDDMHIGMLDYNHGIVG